MSAAAVEQGLGKLAKGFFGLAGASIIPYSCLFDVDGGSRVVMFNKLTGVEEKVRGEGTHLKIPFVMEPNYYTIKLRPKLIQTATGTKDLQTVTIHVRLLYRPKVEGLPQIHSTLGADYDERVLPSIANEILKATIAMYDAEQLLTMREEVSSRIREAIIRRATQFQIEIDDVSITHLTYGKEFARAIEEKQVAEQEAERQKYIVLRSKQEREATIIKAEGEAEAAQMISDALRQHGTGLIEVRRIDAAKEIADSLAKCPNVMYLPNGQSMLLNMGGGGGQRPQQ